MRADFSQIGPFLIAALVVFIIYRRFRRSFGQQLLRRVRMQARIVILLIIGCLLLPVALRSAAFLSALLAGIAAGIALALWGAARFVYRFAQVYTGTQGINAAGLDSASPAFASAGMLRSPLTVGLFFVLVGYYVCYYSLVLRKSKRVIAEEVRSDTSAAELEKRA